MKEKELNIMKGIASIFLVLGILSNTIYDGKIAIFHNIIDFLSKPFVWPIILFVLGCRIYTKKYSNRTLFKYSYTFLIISILFNIICFFIPYLFHNEIVIQNLLIINIFMFISLVYLFFLIIKKIQLSDYILWGVVLLLGVISTFLVVYLQDYNTKNIIINFIRGLFIPGTITSYFAFFTWIIFPVSGYLYAQIVDNKENNSFHFLVGFLSFIVYAIMIIMSSKFSDGTSLIDFKNNMSFYSMNIYGSLMNVSLCLFMYSLSYFTSKIIPSFINVNLKRWGTNIYVMLIISTLIINYIFIGYANNMINVDWVEILLIFIPIFLVTDFISNLIMKKITKLLI